MQKFHEVDLWAERCQLAAMYRLLAYYRMTDIIDTHISLKSATGYFYINNYGIPFEKMTASDMVLIDSNGNVVDKAKQDVEVNKAGFVIHSAIHKAREELTCVIHTHTAAGVAVACQERGLLPISQHALKFYNRLSYHQYEGIALCENERERLVADLAENDAMILNNHGLIAAGRSIAEAFMNIMALERACQIQVQALGQGGNVVLPSHEICEKTAAQFTGSSQDKIVQLAFRAALSLIEDQRTEYES